MTLAQKMSDLMAGEHIYPFNELPPSHLRTFEKSNRIFYIFITLFFFMRSLFCVSKGAGVLQGD